MNKVQILGSDGQPLRQQRPSMLVGGAAYLMTQLTLSAINWRTGNPRCGPRTMKLTFTGIASCPAHAIWSVMTAGQTVR
jgi:hypothetical protein